MSKIAIIGTGISGLAAAYLLHPRHDITVYEKAGRLGGHSRTVTVRQGDRIIPVDTGFIVFNERNYPNLTALLGQLRVAVKASDMTYALSVDGGRLEWGAKSLNTIFGQRRNLIRPRFLKLFAEVMRFNGEVVDRVRRTPGITLGELIDAMGLSDWFKRYYLLPMAGAIWSARPEQMLAFPAQVFVTFFENHSLLSLTGQPQWLTIDGGSERYVEALSASFRHRVRLGCAATRVVRGTSGVRVADASGAEISYDHVVFACHSDEALAMLGDDAGDAERGALGAIKYQPNVAVLHQDPRFMPKRRRCWASWNYHSDGRGDEAAITLTYWMNSLQGIDPACPLFVTLNPPQPIDAARTFDTHLFHHPVFDTAAIAAQKRLALAQGQRNTWFCGAYMRHGFHEDGLVSAMAVAEALGAPAPWLHTPTPPILRPLGKPVPA
ncbi:MAG: FAD-dependent oxidoreductase [Alphaproteobacteria bacterium]|nr:FAD-dependent oxidoreductase [Alphaproteobacteria bacterium]